MKTVLLHTMDGLEVFVEVPENIGRFLVRPIETLFHPFAEHLKGKAKYEELLKENTRRYELQCYKNHCIPVYYEIP